jgi:hypothetical protein
VDEYLSVVSFLITLMHLYLYKITRKPNFVFGDMIRDRRVVYINNLAMNRNTVTRSRKYSGLGQGSEAAYEHEDALEIDDGNR